MRAALESSRLVVSGLALLLAACSGRSAAEGPTAGAPPAPIPMPATMPATARDVPENIRESFVAASDELQQNVRSLAERVDCPDDADAI